jgi:hypothetical protein
LSTGFAGSLEEILTFALFQPKGGTGAKTIRVVHEPPEGTVVQSLVWWNSEAWLPVMAMPLITRSPAPLFITVIVRSGEVSPIFTGPKSSETGVTVIRGDPAPTNIPGSIPSPLAETGSMLGPRRKKDEIASPIQSSLFRFFMRFPSWYSLRVGLRDSFFPRTAFFEAFFMPDLTSS